ncbi:MAG: SCO family protein [Betaproteobacteria bacterium]|nr:SCO family protein [Betaproteobacteria bacterium]
MRAIIWSFAAASLALLVPAPRIGIAHSDHQAGGPAAAEARAAPPAPAGNERWRARYFPNVPLVTHAGKTVRLYDDLLKGRRVVINLVYTQCQDLCPLETARLVQVQRLLGEGVGKDIHFYSISIDPERDTPAVLKAYMEKYGVGPGWTFLTGKKADIALIAKKFGLSSITDAADRDGHLPSLMVGNEPAGLWMRNSAVDNPRFLATKISTFLLGREAEGLLSSESYAQARPIEGLEAGSYLFRTRCAACHTIGGGDGIGPDLAGVASARDRAWLARYIRTPDKVLAGKDPIATALFARYKGVRMPNLRLGDGDVELLIRYLEAQARHEPQRKASAGR